MPDDQTNANEAAEPKHGHDDPGRAGAGEGPDAGTGDAQAEEMEAVQEEAAEEREENGGYQ